MNLLEIRKRFERYITPEALTGCWLWTGGVSTTGYGSFCFGKKYRIHRTSAHRASYEIYKGIPPKNLGVSHKCDVPLCVNPDHLFLATQSENMKDAFRKKRRSLSGIKNPRAKLNNQLVDEIRKSNESLLTLGRKYGVSAGAIWFIKKNLTWRFD